MSILHEDIFMYLLNKGKIDINQKDSNGLTAIDLAQKCCCWPLLHKLWKNQGLNKIIRTEYELNYFEFGRLFVIYVLINMICRFMF